MKPYDDIQNKPAQDRYFWVIWIVAAVLFSVGSVYAQVHDVTLRFIRIQQEKVHVQMMEVLREIPGSIAYSLTG